MRIFSYIVLLVIIILGLTFAVLNATPVTFNYYLGSKELSLSLLLVYTLGIGVILGLLVTLISVIKLKKENFHLKHQLKQAEKELAKDISQDAI